MRKSNYKFAVSKDGVTISDWEMVFDDWDSAVDYGSRKYKEESFWVVKLIKVPVLIDVFSLINDSYFGKNSSDNLFINISPKKMDKFKRKFDKKLNTLLNSAKMDYSKVEVVDTVFFKKGEVVVNEHN